MKKEYIKPEAKEIKYVVDKDFLDRVSGDPTISEIEIPDDENT